MNHSPMLPVSNSNNLGGNTFSSFFSVTSLKQTLTVMRNSSLIVKAFCVCIFIGYIVSFKQSSIQYLSVIPGNLLPPNYYVWTLFTHSFIEYRLLELIADWFIILTFTRMLEPLWGIYECVQFYFIITIVVAISTSFYYLTAFALTFNELFLFDVKIHGLGGLLGGFCVAIKQIMPDTVILNFSFMRIRQDHLPLLLILFSIIVSALKITGLQYAVQVTFGVYSGWLYLRFFQKHKNGTRGDSSSTFTFSTFFPSQIQPFVAIVANTIYNILVKIKVCKTPPKRYNISSMSGSINHGGSQSHITISLPLVQNAENQMDAERRRLKALKALKERLKKPDEEDDPKTQWAENNNASAEISIDNTTDINEKLLISSEKNNQSQPINSNDH